MVKKTVADAGSKKVVEAETEQISAGIHIKNLGGEKLWR